MLIELLLEPVDVGVSSAALAGVGRVRRAARCDHHGSPPALGVVQHPAEILRPDIDVNEHRLCPARRGVVAVRGRQRDQLERTQHGSRNRLPDLLEFRERFLNGKRVGSRVEEEAIDALCHEGADERFRGFSLMWLAEAHDATDLI